MASALEPIDDIFQYSFPALEPVQYIYLHVPALEPVEYIYYHLPALESVEDIYLNLPALESVEDIYLNLPALEPVEDISQQLSLLHVVEDDYFKPPAINSFEDIFQHLPALELVEDIYQSFPALESVEDIYLNLPALEPVENISQQPPAIDSIEDIFQHLPAREFVEDIYKCLSPRDVLEDDCIKNINDEDPVQQEERETFFRLLEEEKIRNFLEMDTCYRISDKYLLAMVLIYFRRAKMEIYEYIEIMFFTALLIANMVEEEESFRNEIYPWALGTGWYQLLPYFKDLKDLFWVRMDFRALVTREMCEQVMAEDPTHWAWTRERKEHHSWAIRRHLRSDDECHLRGPGRSPRKCYLCDVLKDVAVF